MAENPNLNVNLDFSESITAALVRVRRHAASLGLAVELGSQVDLGRVQAQVDNFLPPAGDAQEEIGFLKQARDNLAGRVIEDLAFLVAADEHLAALESVRDSQEG